MRCVENAICEKISRGSTYINSKNEKREANVTNLKYENIRHAINSKMEPVMKLHDLRIVGIYKAAINSCIARFQSCQKMKNSLQRKFCREGFNTIIDVFTMRRALKNNLS